MKLANLTYVFMQRKKPVLLLMRTLGVVVRYILPNAIAQFLHAISWSNVDVFLLDSPPEAFYLNVALTSSLSIHANPDAVPLKQVLPSLGRIQDALV